MYIVFVKKFPYDSKLDLINFSCRVIECQTSILALGYYINKVIQILLNKLNWTVLAFVN